MPEDPEDISIKRLLDEIYLLDSRFGSRKLVTLLTRDHGVDVIRKRKVMDLASRKVLS